MLKTKEIRDKTDQELDEELRMCQKQIFELRSQADSAKEQKTHLIGHKKKEIARILTIKRERMK